MEEISVLIITKNDAEVIGDAINSVKEFAGEIIVIDGGSADNTIELAKKLGARVIENKFKNFSDQRNLAASVAKNEWIFYLDSDERATSDFITELRLKIESARKDPDTAGFWVMRKTYYFGRDWKYTDKVQRVFKKSKLRQWRGIVHETPVIDGALGIINQPILHLTHRNLEQMIAKTNEWSEFEAELRIKSGHPKMKLWRFPRVMLTAFLGSYFGQGGFRNGTAGVIEAVYQMYSMFITYAKLWEKQRKKLLT